MISRLLAAVLASTSALVSAASLSAATADVPSSVSAPDHLGAWGFDLAGRDTSVTPGSDFYRYANGEYLKTLKIPSDRTRYGSFDALAELSQIRVRAVLVDAAANSAATGDEAKVGAAYKAFIDEDRVEALDAKPLAADLAAVRAADTREKLAGLMGRAEQGFFGSFFGLGEQPDAKVPTKYAIYAKPAKAAWGCRTGTIT